MTAVASGAVLAILRADGVVVTHDGYVRDSDESTKTISAPLPYWLFISNGGTPYARRNGRSVNRGTEIQVTAVGGTREQAQWAGERAEGLLDGVAISDGTRSHVITRTDDAPMTGRDDTWTRPENKPLFMDVRRYSVAC